MKKLLLVLTALLIALPLSQMFASNSADWQNEYAQLLQKYVTPTGVLYAAWKKDKTDVAKINDVVIGISHTNPKGMSRDEQLAFYLNAYNAWILHEALGEYPTSSVKDLLFRFFTENRINVGGKAMSFSNLEKSVIRSKFNNPLVHFALNCASRSCPPLYNKPYSGNDLQSTLEGRAKIYVDSPEGVRVTKDGVELSKIFDWYQNDFKKGGGVIAFINKYRKTPLPKDAKISYQNYNWDLNKAK